MGILGAHLNNPNMIDMSYNNLNSHFSNSVFCHSGAFVPFQETYFIFGGFNGFTRQNVFKYFSLKGKLLIFLIY